MSVFVYNEEPIDDMTVLKGFRTQDGGGRDIQITSRV